MKLGSAIALFLFASAAGLLQALHPALPPTEAQAPGHAVPQTTSLRNAGFVATETGPLTRGGRHKVQVFRSAATSCPIYLVSLDLPDEILPLVARHAGDEIWATRRLWLDGHIRPMPDTAFGIKLLTLKSRLINRRSGSPATLLMTHPNCVSLLDALNQSDRKET